MYNLFTLKNGLRVIAEDIDYVNSISVGLWVENGSRNETVQNNGISHFIEHMLFKGTHRRTAKDIAECIEDVGGQLNAFTGKEATCFYIKVLDSHLELALDVLSDMLFNSKFSDDDIEKEKGVIAEEINMSEDSPEDVLSDLHSTAIWGEDSISLPILGTLNTIRTFNREDIMKYTCSHYIPENSVISLSGKFDQHKIERLIEKYFGTWKCNNKKVTKYSKPDILHKHLYKAKKIEQLHLSMGIPGIEIGNEDLYPLILLSNVFGGGASSILFQKIREEKAMCYSVYSYISAFNNTGIVSIYAALNPACAADAINLIKEEIDKFSVKGISAEKLAKAKEQLKGSYILGLESTSSRMFSNGKSVLFLNKVNSPDDIIAKVNNINLDDLNRVAKRTFSNNVWNSAFVGENINMELLQNVINPEINLFSQDRSRNI